MANLQGHAVRARVRRLEHASWMLVSGLVDM